MKIKKKKKERSHFPRFVYYTDGQAILALSSVKWKWKWSLSVLYNSCDPMDCSLPGSSVHGIFQARVLEWGAISLSRGASQPRDQTVVSCIAGRRFTVCQEDVSRYLFSLLLLGLFQVNKEYQIDLNGCMFLETHIYGKSGYRANHLKSILSSGGKPTSKYFMANTIPGFYHFIQFTVRIIS